MRKVNLVALFLFGCQFLIAQNLKFVNKPEFFLNAKNSEIVVFKDQSTIQRLPSNKTFKFYKDSFPATLSEYKSITIGTKNYFVHDGCGPVLEFVNDSLKRIDKSFLHKNQFLSSLFSYKNEIYLLGGYGLFTLKNILTKYNFNNKDWDLVPTNNLEIPGITAAFAKVIGDQLYVFGGYANNKVNTLIYIYDFKNKNWTNYNSNLANYFTETIHYNGNFIEIDLGYYFFQNDKVIFLDLKNNILKKYTNNYIKSSNKSILVKDTLYSLFNLNQDSKYLYEIEKYPLKKHIADLSKFEKEDVVYFEKSNLFSLKIITVALLALVSFYLLYLRRYWFYYLFNSILFVYCTKSKKLYYKGKNVTNLTNYDFILLEKQFNTHDDYFPLSDLNELFSENKSHESVDVIVKRREKKISHFINTINILSKLPPEKICSYRKNSKDKRIRELTILPNLIVFKTC